jgi:hypothetical protein
VVEHPLGKGEAVSSILTGSTRFLRFLPILNGSPGNGDATLRAKGQRDYGKLGPYPSKRNVPFAVSERDASGW